MLSFALYATSSVAKAQIKLAGSDEANGYWTVSSNWQSGSTSGTIGRMSEGDVKTDTYSWDYKTRNFTDEPDPDVNGPNLYPPQSLIQPYSILSNTGNRVLAGSVSYGTKAKVKAGGTLEFTYTWKPYVAGDKPTKDLKLFIGGSAEASAYGNSPVTGTAWAWVVGKPEENAETEQGPVASPSKSARGGKLVTVGKENLSFTTTLSLEAGAETPGLASGERVDTMAVIDSWTKVDNRSVSLSRSGAHDEWPDDDGITMHGDTIYSAYLAAPNTVNFNSSLSGDWSRGGSTLGSNNYNVTWNWVASGDGFSPC